MRHMLREAKRRNRESKSMHIHFHPSSEEKTLKAKDMQHRLF